MCESATVQMYVGTAGFSIRFADEKNGNLDNIILLNDFFKVRLDFLREECYIILIS